MARGRHKKGVLASSQPAPLFIAPKPVRGGSATAAIDPLAGREFELKLEGVASGGELVAARDGIKFFVDVGCPGQTVLVRVESSGNGVAYARRTQVLAKSPDQAEPFCPYFGKCGGCSWQEIPYERQLEIKKSNFIHTLVKVGDITNPPIPHIQPLIASPETKRFRSKMEFAFANSGDQSQKNAEGALLGLRKRGSHQVVEVEDCPVASELLGPVLRLVRGWVQKSGLMAWEPDDGLKGGLIGNKVLRFLNTRTAHSGSGLAVELVTYPAPNAAKMIRQLGEDLLALTPATSFAHLTREAEDNQAQGENLVLRLGDEFLCEKIGKYEFDLAPGAFFQTNLGVAGLLQEKVLELAAWANLPPGDVETEAWDLYSGAGALTLPLAPLFGRVAGFELSVSAVISAKHNALRNGIDNCIFEAGDAQKLVRSFAGSPRLVVLDPPRAGLARELVKTLLIKKVPILIYVSCNPQTLARDLKSLSEKYELCFVQGLDMFPHTPHMEAVALLKRR